MNSSDVNRTNETNSQAADVQPSASTEWAAWLSKQEEIWKTVYRTQPNLLIADFNRERECSRDYEGREILELLQNANDAAARTGEPSKVEIRLMPECLIVANTGVPFASDGVESLQTSNFSPKRRNRRAVIGNKGLGFRAILNWSRSPIILSGGLRIAYSQEYSTQVLSKLMEENENVAAIVSKERHIQNDLPVPLLVFPGFNVAGALESIVVTESANKVLTYCEELCMQGFVTAIGMPFDRPKAFERALYQLASLRPELLLFVPNLASITIRREGHPPEIWQCEKGAASTRVFVNEAVAQEWTVYSEAKNVPTEYLGREHSEAADYEIVVAIPKIPYQKFPPLFSHFPTAIRLPLPAVCHATLDLQQNRQHAHVNPANSFILGRLAEFLAEVAERETVAHPEQPWAGCDLLRLRADLDPDLQRMSFQPRMLAAATCKPIVPTLDGSHVPATGAKLLPGADEGWLPLPQFGKMVPWRDQATTSFLQSIGAAEITVGEIVDRLSKLEKLSIPSRAALISGMIQHNIAKEAHTPALLLDAAGLPANPEARVFLAPSTGQTVPLPPWAEIQFLNDDLRRELATRLQTRDARQLQSMLSTFRVVEYSLDNVIRSLVAVTNRRTKEDATNAGRYDSELVHILFQLFPAGESDESRPKFPQDSSLRLLTQAGGFAEARTLYMGSGYPPYGDIVQGLFGHCAQTKLVASPGLLGLDDGTGNISNFLRWVGVAIWPRDTIEAKPDREFTKFALRSLTYPAKFSEQIYDLPDQVPSPSVAGVRSLDELDQMLQTSDPFAIVAWLALDDRASHWQSTNTSHATLRCDPPRAKNYRIFVGPLPSYIRWRIQHTSWLPLTNTTKGKPGECIAGERAIEAFFPRPLQPPPETVARFGLSPFQIRDGWTRAGVLPGLAYLEREEIYRILLDLPRRDPTGQSARALYRWLMDADESAIGGAGPACDEFKKCGQMWGHAGQNHEYFPIAELRHADSEDFPEPLLMKLKVVDLPKRVGSGKVEKFFGVKPVEKDRISKGVKFCQLAVGHEAVSTEFQRAKPYLFALRRSQTTQEQNLNRLRRLTLRICSKVSATVDYEGQSFDYDLGICDWLVVNDELFVCSDPIEPASLSSDLLADAIGAALASIFRLGDGGDFARLLHCGSKDRDRLLRRMRAEGSQDDLERLKMQFDSDPYAGIERINVPVDATTVINSVTVHPTILIPALPPKSPLPPADIQQDTPVDPTNLTIVEESRIVSQPQQRIPLRVQRPPLQTGFCIMSGAREVVDWEFCEKKAMEFELSDKPPRFPLQVSLIQGYHGPSCDILSFKGAEARKQFLESEDKDARAVQRFIEVKARSNERARIILRGNELDAASRYGNRYFLYRLFEQKGGDLVLAVLQQPLEATGAIEQFVEVNLERAQQTREFHLSGGLSKSAAASWDGKQLPEVPNISDTGTIEEQVATTQSNESQQIREVVASVQPGGDNREEIKSVGII